MAETRSSIGLCAAAFGSCAAAGSFFTFRGLDFPGASFDAFVARGFASTGWPLTGFFLLLLLGLRPEAASASLTAKTSDGGGPE